MWAYLSDTFRFNREMGLVPREQFEKDGKQLVKTKMLGLDQEWVEDPWTWIEGKTISNDVILNMKKSFSPPMYDIFHKIEYRWE